MSEVTLTELESHRDTCKQAQEYIDAHHRLTRNKDFKRIILEDFLVKDCARYVQESTDPMLTKEQRESALAMSQAAGHLKRYLQVNYQLAKSIADQRDDLEEAINQLNSEEVLS